MSKQHVFPDDGSLDRSLLNAVEAVRAEPIPQEAIRRAAQRAKQIPPRPRRSRWTKTLQAAASLAALALVCIALIEVSSPDALAQVAAAVSKEPWLHATGTGPNGQPIDIWFSAQRGVLASRLGSEVTFVDRRLAVMDVYEGNETVYRVPIRRAPDDGFERAKKSFEAMLSGDLEKSFRTRSQRVVDHEKRNVKVDGREVVEHRFTVRAKDGDEAKIESILRADPRTHLPFWWESRKRTGVVQLEISYPKQGPETIYALDVPCSANLVDQVPRRDLQRILAGVSLAPRRFDNYRAVVIQSDSAERREGGHVYYQVWRKGPKWRIEQFRVAPYGEIRAPEDADPNAWWLRQAAEFESYPVAISDGKVEWLFDAVPAKPRRPDPDNPDYLLIDSLGKKKREFAQSPIASGYPRPHEHEMVMPEFYGYPSLWRTTAPGFETNVEPEPSHGPEETVLVDIARAKQEASRINGFRYWSEPKKSYLVMRRETLRGNRDDGASEIVQADSTPQGYWYPTVVHIPNGSIHLESGEKSDYYYRYYLEFDAGMPDALFNPTNAEAP